MHIFEALEDAVITALEPLKEQGLRTLEAYSGQVETDSLEQVTLRFPCIYVIAERLMNKTKNQLDGSDVSLQLIVGDRNVRNLSAAARGDNASPGVYSLLESARGLLHRVRMVRGWTPLFLSEERPLVYAPQSNLCLYAAIYNMRALKGL